MRRIWGLIIFLILLCWVGSMSNGWWVHTGKSSPWLSAVPNMGPFLLALRFRQDRNQSLSSPLEGLVIAHIFQSSLPSCSAREKIGPGSFFLIVLSWLAGGATVSEYKHFLLTWMQLFSHHLGCKSLLPDFWIYHKRNWSMCCWISVSVGRER